jgi:kynureninase
MNLPRKDLFDLPRGIVYLDGNSLGPLPRSVAARVQEVVTEQWGIQLIRAWNTSHWMEQPARVGNQVAQLIGAPAGSVVMGDTLSIKVFQALSAALALRPDRRVILSDTGNFPSDLYMAQGLIALKGAGIELRVVDPERVAEVIDESIAAVLLTEVDYRTGRLHDMQAISTRARDAGAVMIWDLAHSAGALEVDIVGSGCEFAVGCTYKYLNGGPGAPAFIYVRPDIVESAQPSLTGWLGHDSPFAFETHYRPAPGIERMRVGTPSVIQLAALEAALCVWEGVKMSELRTTSIRLSEQLICEVDARCPQLTLASPRDSALRGSQVSFKFEHGFAAMQALIDRGVIGDFRAPDIMRFGITPLYLDETDISAAVDALHAVLSDRLWDEPKYRQAKRVT